MFHVKHPLNSLKTGELTPLSPQGGLAHPSEDPELALGHRPIL